MTQFGLDVTAADVVETLSFFDSWEDRYRYIIDLGKELEALPLDKRTDESLVRGCQSQVWLISRLENDRLYFEADSDAFIVKGLLALVLAAFNGKTRAEILSFDIEGYFAQLQLIQHLSSTRGNGLKAMVKRIQETAKTL